MLYNSAYGYYLFNSAMMKNLKWVQRSQVYLYSQ